MDRAVDVVEKALDLYGAPVYVRKEIVHNKFVVESLTKRGAIFVQETDQVPEGARVVFSAHGVSPEVHAVAAQRHLATIDATCPLVTKVHREAVRYAKDDYDIILVGHEGHEEVEGTFGEAPNTFKWLERLKKSTIWSFVTLSALCGFRRRPSLLMRRVKRLIAYASVSPNLLIRLQMTFAMRRKIARVL